MQPRKKSKLRTRRSKAIGSNIWGVIPVPRSSTQAALLTSSARGGNRAHEFLHLLLLLRPLGCSFGGGRRFISCPLAHSATLAQDILGILPLSVLRSLRALRDLYGCAIHVGVSVRAGDVELDISYITFMMSAQYTGLLGIVQSFQTPTTPVVNVYQTLGRGL